jgi:hypothetical protein
MKDCRTCGHSTDQYFCKRILDVEVKKWSDKNVGYYSDIEEDCPGWTDRHDRRKRNENHEANASRREGM